MMFGEKLRKARLEAGYTQEELAATLTVSRSAIAKWEGDRGLPDISNMKAIAEALNVSVDFLLDEAQPMDLSVIKKAIDLKKYGEEGRLSRLKKMKIKEKIIRKEYPASQIIRLTVTAIKNSKGETVADQVIGWLGLIFGNIPLFGSQELGKMLSSFDQQYYLVNEDRKQYFVLMTDEFLVARVMTTRLDQKKFQMEDRQFMVVGEVD